VEGEKYIPRLVEMSQKVKEIFKLTEESFKEGDAEKGSRAMEQHAEIARFCDSILEELIRDDVIAARKAIVCALLTRYLKRISAHLKNIASSVVNPFERIGYRPQQ
jgi:phosphate uptake regulator